MSRNKTQKEWFIEVPVVIYPDFSTWKTYQWEIVHKTASMFQNWCSWQREEAYRSEAVYWGSTETCHQCGQHEKERLMFVGFKELRTYLNEPNPVNYFCSFDCWSSWLEDYGFLFEETTL